MFEQWRKKFNEREYQKGLESVAEDVAGKDAAERQAILREVGQQAAETINLANELAADKDPHKAKLAALLKDAAIGAVDAVKKGQLPQEGGEASKALPFSDSSNDSTPSSPESMRGLPNETTDRSGQAKARRGRPPGSKNRSRSG